MGRILMLLAMSAIALATVAAIDTSPQVAAEPEAEPADKGVLRTSSENDPIFLEKPQVLKVFRNKEAEEREGKLLAFYTTKTKAVIATSTAFALSTCFSTTNMPSCSGGRKRRNIFNDQINPRLTLESSSHLRSSLDEPEPDVDSVQGTENASGRKFTVWSTSFSTYTVVTTSYYMGTTITVSALCNPGIAASCWG